MGYLISLNLPYLFYFVSALRLISYLDETIYILYGGDTVNGTAKVLRFLRFAEGDSAKDSGKNNRYL